jgi:hypothetical protein
MGRQKAIQMPTDINSIIEILDQLKESKMPVDMSEINAELRRQPTWLKIKWHQAKFWLHMFNHRPWTARCWFWKVSHRVVRAVLHPVYCRLPEHLSGYGPWMAYKKLAGEHVWLGNTLKRTEDLQAGLMKELYAERDARIAGEVRLLGIDAGTLKTINKVMGTSFPTTKLDE